MNNNPKKPLVSVILPVFKSEEFLQECLNSLSKQTYKNLEIVAVVDYLGDHSLKILRKHKKTDKRLKIYSNLQRYGLASTLNRALRHAKGDYLAFMDSMGIADKTRVAKQVKFLNANEKVAAVGSQTALVNERNRRIEAMNFPLEHETIYKNLISAKTFKFESAMIAKKRLPNDILKFDKQTVYPFVFAQVFLKIGIYKELANLPEELIKIRSIVNTKKKSIRMDKKLSFIKLLFESTTLYEYKPSVRSLFTPILRQA